MGKLFSSISHVGTVDITVTLKASSRWTINDLSRALLHHIVAQAKALETRNIILDMTDVTFDNVKGAYTSLHTLLTRTYGLHYVVIVYPVNEQYAALEHMIGKLNGLAQTILHVAIAPTVSDAQNWIKDHQNA